jgi:hypothetical protein
MTKEENGRQRMKWRKRKKKKLKQRARLQKQRPEMLLGQAWLQVLESEP